MAPTYQSDLQQLAEQLQANLDKIQIFGFTDDVGQVAANQAVDQLLNEQKGDLQNVVMSMAKADLSLKFIVEVRNKMMDAYQEIMRMPI